jgi:hypothetical protein
LYILQEYFHYKIGLFCSILKNYYTLTSCFSCIMIREKACPGGA